jgi:hypothetical protein
MIQIKIDKREISPPLSGVEMTNDFKDEGEEHLRQQVKESCATKIAIPQIAGHAVPKGRDSSQRIRFWRTMTKR